MSKLINTYKAFLLLFGILLTTGCEDWNSKPNTVDDHFGDAVRHMIKAQTLNPDPGYSDAPVLGLDGKKSEGNIKVYRSGNTDLRQGKSPVKLNIRSRNN